MRLWIALAFFLAVSAPEARAEGERAGTFDYYMLALSWSPSWCALESAAHGSPQCQVGANFGWILHGLWPQYHRGWPAFCSTPHPQPTRGLTLSMADIMGSSGLAWYQWKKHGSCSGLSARDYYALSRRAFDSIRRPAIFRNLQDQVRLPAKVVEEAFLKTNPSLGPNMITITCKQGRIQEARICLSKDLNPVRCGRDVVRDCRLKDALFAPVR